MNIRRGMDTDRLIREIEFYRRIGSLYASLRDLNKMQRWTLELIIQQMNVEAGSLFLLDSSKKNIVFNVVSGRARKKLLGRKLPLGIGIAGYVTKTGKPYLTKNASKDRRWLREIGEEVNFKTREVLCVPLFGMDGIIGAVEVLNKKDKKGFTADDVDFLKSNAGQLGVLIEHSKLLEEAKERVHQLSLLRNIGTVINSTLKEEEIRKRTIEAITNLMNSEAGSLLMLDEKTGELYFDVAHGEKGDEVKRIRLKSGEGIAGWVASRGTALIVNDVLSDRRFSARADEASRFITRNIICAPVKLKGVVIGVIEAINKKDGIFSKADLNLLKYLADQVAIAIENAKLYTELRETFLNTAEALAEAIEQRDPYTGGHTRRVLDYCVSVAQELKFTEEEMENLRLSAILHDIGKIGVEDRILRKPAPLDNEELERMKMHPQIGAEIIKHIRKLQGVVPGILYHQERYDGKGYPFGLKNGDIPMTARIISVCDTFDAMTTDRPYRKGLGVKAALDELERFAELQFDGNVVRAFKAAYEKGKILPGGH